VTPSAPRTNPAAGPRRLRWLSFLWMAADELRAPAMALGVSVGALFLVGFFVHEGAFSPRFFALPAAAFLGAAFWGWLEANRRLQVLEDLPLSRIATAAQGYARLEGRAQAFPGKPLASPVSHQVCCWYSYEYWERDKEGERRNRQRETSEWSFMLRDATGECVIDPADARLVTVRVARWNDDVHYYVERLIVPGDPLFVIGSFTTSSAAVLERDLELRVGELVSAWKKDMPTLLRRFDLDGNREFSAEEWRLVRAEARREVERDLARDPPQPQNLVSRPADGSPFIIGAQDRDELARNLRIWAWFHLLLFVLGVAAAAQWLLRQAAG
jgi:hypothetical protein